MKTRREYWGRKYLKIKAYSYKIYPENGYGETNIARLMLQEKLLTPPHKHVNELKKLRRERAEYKREKEGIKLRRTRKNIHRRHLALTSEETSILRRGILRVRADGSTYVHTETE